MSYRRIALTVAAVTAVAAPTAAFAGKPEWAGTGHGPPWAGGNHGSAGQGHGPAKGVMYIFKGTYSGASVVTVTKGNAHVRRAGLVGTDVAFDLGAAKLTVADTSGDGTVTVDDVVPGDKVVVKAKLPKGDPGAAPYAARQLVDQTNPPAAGPSGRS